MLWVVGEATNAQLITAIASAFYDIVGAAKFSKFINTIKLIIEKGWQTYSGDWYGLMWTVVDVVMTFVPYYKLAAVIVAAQKLIPLF